MERLVQLIRRRDRDRGHVFEDLRDPARPDDLVPPHGLPPQALHGVRTFYDLLHGEAAHHCDGTSCWAARGGKTPKGRGAHCLGRCYEPPARPGDEGAPIPWRSLGGEPRVLRHLAGADPWEDYDLPDGTTILDALEKAGLRGRGGAAYPTAAKWRAARDTPAPDRIVVANGDEGDPGAYVDRLLLEEAPHAVLAGMLACARAIGARRGIIYVRGEYPRAPERLRSAIDEARAKGHLGDELDVAIVRGAGSYVAGEETALLRSIEGLRAEPRPKPPYPAQRGLGDLPTIVQNVETLGLIPWIVRTKADARRKAFCLSGAVKEPGLVEAPLGTTIQELIEACGGATRPLRMALVGGPMGRVVTDMNTPLSYDGLRGMGHGGVVVLDDRISPRALAEHLFAFARNESCGNCTPCRVGSAQLEHMRDRASFERLLRTMEVGSLCGFGTGVPAPLRDLLAHFGDEVLAC